MRLKTYTAETIAKAMDVVRRELGADAIIVATQAAPGGRGVRITAALDREEHADPQAAADDRDGSPAAAPVADPARGIERALAFHGLPGALAERLLAAARPFAAQGAVIALGAAIDEAFAFQPINERQQARPLMLVGPPGVGKTIAAAKLLMRALRCGRKAVAITTDVRRAGGIEQLQAFTAILGIELITVDCGEALEAAFDREPGALVIVDTAGTNPLADGELHELGTLIAAIDAEPILVLAAGADAAEQADAAQAFEGLGVQRLLATRIDVVRRLGGLLSAAAAASLAFSDVSISPDVADGLAAINPVSLARLLLPSATVAPAPFHRSEASRS